MMVMGALIGPVTQSAADTRLISGVAVGGGARVCENTRAVGEGCGVVVGAAVALGIAVGKTGLGHGVGEAGGGSVGVGGDVGVGPGAGARQAASSTPAAAIQLARRFNTRASFIPARL